MTEFRVLVAGVPYGYQGSHPHGKWLTEDHIQRLRSAGPDVAVCNPSVDELNDGWTPARPPHALLVETSGTNSSWESLPDVLFGEAFLRLLSDETVFVQSCSAGVEHLTKIMPSTIPLCNASGVHAKAIAETVMGSILARAKYFSQRRLDQADRLWRQLPCQELTGSVMCILGTGRIGSAVARLAKSFEMVTVGIRQHVAPADYFDEVKGPESLQEVLRRSDYVVIACPLTPATEEMLSAPEFAVMKPGVFIANVSRGAIVDEPALIAAIRDGRVGGALLDCLVEEPLPADDPLWNLPGVEISPHDSHASQLLGDHHLNLFRENVRRACAGEPLLNVVDLSRGY